MRDALGGVRHVGARPARRRPCRPPKPPPCPDSRTFPPRRSQTLAFGSQNGQGVAPRALLPPAQICKWLRFSFFETTPADTPVIALPAALPFHRWGDAVG